MPQQVVGGEVAGQLVDDFASILQDNDTIGMLECMMNIVESKHECVVPTLQQR
jgi:hypothetical protein